MAGKRQAAWIGALTAVLIAAATSAVAETIPRPPAAVAETVPLPPPAPLPKIGVPPPPSAQTPPGSRQTTQSTPPAQSSGSSWLPSIFGGGQQQQQQQQQQGKPAASTLEPAQRALVDKVSAYLTRVQVMSGDFHQVGPDGRQAKGQFYVQKPGKVRFDYDLPSRIDIIADGSSVVVRDRKLATQDVYPLSQTPLRFLLADRIDLLKDTNVTQVYADDLFVTVVVEEKTVLVGTSKLMMMFGAKDFQLKQWVVTDPQGYDTTIAVSNIDIARRPDPSLFKIDYTQYPN